jgi:hypothetical protein
VAKGNRRRPKKFAARYSPWIAYALESSVLLANPSPAVAGEEQIVYVNNCSDHGEGSLRTALISLLGDGIVDMTGLTCGTINLTGGELTATPFNLTVKGPGRDALTITSNHASRLFAIYPQSGSLTISNVTLADGAYDSDLFAAGGCIYSETDVTLDNVRLSGCRARSTNPDLASDARGGGVWARNVTVTRSEIIGNYVQAQATPYGSAAGAGIAATGTLNITDSVISGNSTVSGAGIVECGAAAYARRNTKITSSTVSGNTTSDGSIFCFSYGPVSVIDSTISGNEGSAIRTSSSVSIYNSTIAFNALTGGANGAGLNLLTGAVVNLQSSILWGNTSGLVELDLTTDGNVAGANNVIGVANVPLPADTMSSDPLLQVLADNGGRTPTHALGMGSPAIDAGNNVLSLLDDQRGPQFPRVLGPRADIGAYESGNGESIFFDGFEVPALLAEVFK